MVDIQLKTRSLGQTLAKPCVRSRGHIFSSIIMKLGQNLCLDEISDKFEMCHVGSKTKTHVESEKNLVYTLKARFSVRLS